MVSLGVASATDRRVLMAQLYDRPFDFPRVRSPRSTYMIAAIPRTGSTLLSVLLWRTGILGAPLEYLNYKNHGWLIDQLGNGDVEKYWREIKQLRTSPNGVFGYKAFLQNLHETAKKYGDVLEDITPKQVIYLTRRDRISHAISYALASQTNAWFADVKYQKQPRYDPKMIAHMQEAIRIQEESWEKVFEMKDVKPIRLEYEDLVSDPDNAVRTIIKALGVRAPINSLNIPLVKRQSKPINKRWIKRYRASLELNQERGHGA